ncbi:hypothetical protein DV736_g1368, partial [Chaetothyriales sp. CBS 134916]
MLIAAVSAYRPVQFVKHTGDNGRADQGFSLTQHYNTTTDQSDLYIRLESFRYKSSARGWAALALGPEMKGALMFILYGDPASGSLTFSVRTADGHHPPELVSSMTDFYQGPIPDVEVVHASFEHYSGTYYSPVTQSSPSHIGVVDFIVRGYTQWAGCEVSNSTVEQQLIWSSNFKQDFEGDFSLGRHIDMHQFGLGFGWVTVDLANAEVPEPFFGPIEDQEGHKGVNEIAAPAEPTQEELDAGAAIIAALGNSSSSGVAESATSVKASPEGTTETAALTPTSAADSAPNIAPPAKPSTTLNPNPEVEQPAHSYSGSLLRNVMWHIHGLLMVVAFLVFLPLGTYVIRSGHATAFNLHWTVQALGAVAVVIGSVIGYVNSRRISITHQYVGFAMLLAIAAQGLLGWRHHVLFVATKRRSRLSTVHTWLGRALLPIGFLNTLSGLRLRHYSWFTQLLVVLVMIAELGALTYYILVVARRRTDQGVGGAGARVGKEDILRGTEADDHGEEYFQLAGDDGDDDDDDEYYNEEEAARERAQRNRLGQAEEEEKRQKAEQAERLRRLDRV